MRSTAQAAKPSHSASMLMSFTGLIPVVLAVPILIFHLYALGIVVSLVSTALVIAFHLRKGQGITSLDLAALLFGIVTGVLYFGFHNTTLMDHLDAVFYTMLFAQVAWAQWRGEPWTVQYAKRSYPPELWTSPGFLAGNRFVSLLWGASFLACDIAALVGRNAVVRLYLPVVLLVGTAVLTPRLARWYGGRVVGVPSTAKRG